MGSTSGTELRDSEDYFITVNNDPGPTSNVFWSNQFAIGKYNGYTGLQSTYLTPADNPGPTTLSGKQFLFSIWKATKAKPGSPGSWCTKGTDGKAGASCHYLYSWIVGHTYRFHLAPDGTQPRGWFQVTVNDMNGTDEFIIGSLFLPNAPTPDTSTFGLNGGLWVQWTEYYEWNDPRTSCGTAPYSQATFGASTTINGNTILATINGIESGPTCATYSYVQTINNATECIQSNGVGNSVRGQIKGHSLCLNANGGLTNGTNIMLEGCGIPPEIASNEAWIYANDNSIRTISNYCVTVPDGKNMVSGSLVTLENCVHGGAKNQQWKFRLDHKFSPVLNASFCLASSPSNQIVISDCTNAPTWVKPVSPNFVTP